MSWKFWPALSAFGEQLYSISRHVQKLFLGMCSLPKGTASLEGLKRWVKSMNFVGPSANTVCRWQPPLALQSSVHAFQLGLHLKVLEKADDSLAIRRSGVVR